MESRDGWESTMVSLVCLVIIVSACLEEFVCWPASSPLESMRQSSPPCGTGGARIEGSRRGGKLETDVCLCAGVRLRTHWSILVVVH